MQIQVEADTSAGELPHFWKAAGDDFAYDWTFTPVGAFLLEEIRRTGCLRWFRNHHALSWDFKLPGGKQARTYAEDARGNPVYDFSGITAVYDRWLAAGLKPVVELDYLPEALRVPGGNNHTPPRDWGRWRDLLHNFVSHLQERYGVEETRSWYFEAWNEPDWWPRERIGEFFRIYDEFAAAVSSVDPQLRMGGPATFTESMLGAFLDHTTFGKNYVSGETGSRVDFLSHHVYGVSGNTLSYYPAFTPRTQDIALRVYWICEMLSRYPGALQKEFHLNEWGIVSHFEKTSDAYPPLEIRNSEYSPLFLMKLIHLLLTLADNKKSFLPQQMLYWGGAYEASVGLFAGNRALVTAHEIAKPMLRGYQLLAQLGNTRLLTRGSLVGEDVGLIATHNKRSASDATGDICILLYHFVEDPAASPAPRTIDLEIRGLSADGPATVEITRLDREHANAYRAWEALSRPVTPDAAQVQFLRDSSELRVNQTYTIPVQNGGAQLHLTLPGQSSALLTLRPHSGGFAAPRQSGSFVIQHPTDYRPA